MTGDPLAAYMPLAVTERSGRIESVHHAAVVGLDADGEIVLAHGDPAVSVYPRSSMKPLQAVAMVESGLDLPDDLLALVCSSHDGRSEHVAGVHRILEAAGLDPSYLRNTHDLPLDEAEAERVLRAGGAPSAIQHNCSGKHAGMVATCASAGWPTDGYLNLDHPLQVAITERVERMIGAPVDAIGVDGCGAPAHMMSLVELARAFRTIATSSSGSSATRVRRAMTSFPAMVGGPARDVTRLMLGVPGLVAKDGAEGVFAVALADGRAVALKVADGANRPRPPLMRAALGALGVDLSGVDENTWAASILGHGRPVGSVRIVDSWTTGS